jgi:hypothetical protein
MMASGRARQRQSEFPGAICGKPTVGHCLALKIGLEADAWFCVGHPLERQSMLYVLSQQI